MKFSGQESEIILRKSMSKSIGSMLELVSESGDMSTWKDGSESGLKSSFGKWKDSKVLRLNTNTQFLVMMVRSHIVNMILKSGHFGINGVNILKGRFTITLIRPSSILGFSKGIVQNLCFCWRKKLPRKLIWKTERGSFKRNGKILEWNLLWITPGKINLEGYLLSNFSSINLHLLWSTRLIKTFSTWSKTMATIKKWSKNQI